MTRRNIAGAAVLLMILSGIYWCGRYAAWVIWHSPPQRETSRTIYYIFSRYLLDQAKSNLDFPQQARDCVPPDSTPLVMISRCLKIEGNQELHDCPGWWKFDNCASIVVANKDVLFGKVGSTLVDVLENPCKYVRPGDKRPELYGAGIYVDMFGCDGEEKVPYRWSVVAGNADIIIRSQERR